MRRTAIRGGCPWADGEDGVSGREKDRDDPRKRGGGRGGSLWIWDTYTHARTHIYAHARTHVYVCIHREAYRRMHEGGTGDDRTWKREYVREGWRIYENERKRGRENRDRDRARDEKDSREGDGGSARARETGNYENESVGNGDFAGTRGMEDPREREAEREGKIERNI